MMALVICCGVDVAERDRVDARLDLVGLAHLGVGGDAKPADRPRDDVLQIAVVAAIRKHVLDHLPGRDFVLPGELVGDLAGERHRLGLVLAVVDVQRG